MASGSGLSGSTAWHGAFRFRHYLKSPRVTEDQPDTALRELEFKKNQYGPAGETVALRWQRGLFLPLHTNELDQAVADAQDDQLFLELLDKFTAQGRNVSHVRQANNFAPTMFAEAAPGKRKALGEAMARLFAGGQDQGRGLRQTITAAREDRTAMISDFVRLAPIVPRPACVPHHFYRVPHGVLYVSCMGTAWVLQGGRPASGLPLEAGRMRVPALRAGDRPSGGSTSYRPYRRLLSGSKKSGQTSGVLEVASRSNRAWIYAMFRVYVVVMSY